MAARTLRDIKIPPKPKYTAHGGLQGGKTTNYSPNVLDGTVTTTYHGALNGPIPKSKNTLGGKRATYTGPQPRDKAIPGMSGGSLTGTGKKLNKGQAL